MQKPIDTTKRINQLLLRASKPLNTLGERKRVNVGGGGGGGGRRGAAGTNWLERRNISSEAEREEDEIKERGECGGK